MATTKNSTGSNSRKSTKKPTKKIEQNPIIPEEIKETPKVEEKPVKISTKTAKGPKFSIGDIVYISKNAQADLNGFNLFPQYKNNTYTVEAYDAISEAYTLRRLKLLVKLPEEFIQAPDERAHDTINRKQF